MKVLLLLAIVTVGGILLAKYIHNDPPLRGLTQSAGSSVLMSRARPLVSFKPAPNMRLIKSGWCNVSPNTHHPIGGDARVCMVLYENAKGTLITTLSEAEGEWQWEAAHHTPFPVLREMKEVQGSETLHESLYVLPAERDPFRSVDRPKGPSVPTEHAACLVYRAKFLLNFRNMQVIYEYHEPIEEGKDQDIAYDLPGLNDFVQRGREACAIVLQPDQKHDCTLHRLDTMDRAFSRGLLGRWTGDMQRRGEL